MPYELNQEQLNVINSSSPCVCQASAGSGKTRTLVAKVQSLLDAAGIAPKNILCVTFTNRAANEMLERLKKSYSGDLSAMQVSTIHSCCVRIIKKFPQESGLRVPFSIYDDHEQLSVIKTLLKARQMADDPYDVIATISRAKGDQSEDQLDERTAMIYEQYQKVLKANNAADFDDLLIYAYEALLEDSCNAYFSNLWEHILCDEMQDSSRLQYNIILSLYKPDRTKTLFFCLDLNQSIYSWRGARPDNMKEFIKEYNPSVINLTYNYRSCPEVIAHANDYLQYGDPMQAKSNTTGKVSVTVFNSLEEEAEKIAGALKQMGGYDQTAIIYRMNSRSLQFEKAFARYGIPYKVAGTAFMARKVSKDLVAYLKAATNPSDMESYLRIVNVPKRGFGEAKQERFMHEGVTYLKAMAASMEPINEFLKLLEDIKDMKPMYALSEVLSQTGYQQTLDKDTDRDMVDALLDAAAGYDTIGDMVLAASFLEKDSGHGVNLVTAHGSKGLEWDRVFVVGMESGTWPHKFSLDIMEEYRLYFVAVSRSRRYLNLSYSKTKLYKGTSIDMEPSDLFRKSFRAITGKDY